MKHILAALTIAVAAPAYADTFGPYSDLLVFGDSLSDAGNVDRLTGGAVPNPRVYPNGQFTNADTWAKQLGSDIGNPLTGEIQTNFAYGSARAVENGDQIPDFGAQIDIFQAVSPSLGDNPLAAVWFGGNDLRDLGVDIFTANAVAEALGTPAAELAATVNALVTTKVSEIAASIAGGVLELATQSGLDDFLVFLAPDLSTAPALVGTENAPLFFEIVQGTNAAIQFAVGQVAAALPINVDFFDPNLVAAEIFADPAAFGLNPKLVTSQCYVPATQTSDATFCGLDNASDYYFFDDIHPTEAVHSALADAVRAQVVPLPGGMSLALGGFVLLGFAARRKRAA
ncbi:MAG: SGNH/GDSL hydrolase family protein [Paracoccaceae bacterium]